MRTLCLLLLCSVILFKSTGQPGSLEPTFGNNGIQTTAVSNNANTLSEEGRAILTNANGDIFVVVNNYVDQINSSYTRIAKYLPDGRLDSSYGNAGYSNAANLGITSAVMQEDKIIVAGIYNYGNLALARYTADGTLDSTFGVNGIVTGPEVGEAKAIALQGDKILVAGYALVRYTADGTLDSTFGIVTTNLNSNAIVLQDDKIILAGYTLNSATSYDFALARYTTNGALDSSFGVNGRVTTDFSADDIANAIAIQGDKIIVAGSTGHYDDFSAHISDYISDFALVRYTADGTLDSSFGENGKVTTDFNGSEDRANAIAVQGDKIIVGGYTFLPDGTTDFALARYTSDGALDASFGENGKVTTDFNNPWDYAYALALQGDKIIVAGYTGNPYSDFALARYTANGLLDPSFGEQGILTGYFPIRDGRFSSTVMQGDKIIAVGTALSDFILARYMTNGALDSSFGVNGLVLTDFNNSYDQANAIALQGDKIVVGGWTLVNGAQYALARYTADGTLDSTFGINGKVTTDFNNSLPYAASIALQGDKIIMAGSAFNSVNNTTDFVLVGYTKDGTLDPSFGVNGLVITDFNNSNDGASTIAVQGNKIIVGGSTADFAYIHYDFALARYTADGVLDSSFAGDGKVITNVNVYNDQANAIALQGDKIVIAGYTGDCCNGDFALARYTANGSLDTSFGENGIVTTDFNNTYNYASSITVQGDKIIAAGSTGHFENGNIYVSDFALARYTTNGTLDSSFGVNGLETTHLTGSSSIHAIAVHENRLYAVGNLTLFTNESYGVVAAYQLEASKPTVNIADVTVPESKKFAVVTVSLSAPATKWVRVNYTTRDKTATYPQDYLHVRAPLLFAPGTTTAKAYVPLVNDDECEGTEQFEVLLTKAYNSTLQDSIGVVTITDDDHALITKQSTSLRMNASPNPSTGTFTVQLQGSNVKQPVSIRVYDINGRLLEQREHISIGQSLRLGDQYKAGTYIIEALQGNRSVQTKVIKTGQ
jgi:uncharacterized delta-60 repeat protein